METEAKMDDGSPQEVIADLFPLLTAAERATLRNIMAAIATKAASYLA